MLIGRFWMMLPTLAIAGSLAGKKLIPQSAGTLRTDGPLFVGLLIAVIVVVGALSFFPALALGPIVEHLVMVRVMDESAPILSEAEHLHPGGRSGPPTTAG